MILARTARGTLVPGGERQSCPGRPPIRPIRVIQIRTCYSRSSTPLGQRQLFNRSAHSAGPFPQLCVFGFASRWLQCCSGRLSDAERYSSIKLVGLQQPLRGLLGLLQGLLGVSGGLLGAYRAYLSSLDCLRGLLGALGHLLGASWGPPGGLLGASWGDSGLKQNTIKRNVL